MTAAIRSRGVGVAALTALAATLALALPVTRAQAVESVAPAARGLAGGRLYVDPAVRSTVDAATRARLASALARRDEPIHVALVPFAPGDAFDGDGPRFLLALAGRLQRPGVYVTYDARGILWTRGYRIASDVEQRASQAARVVDLEGRFDGPPGPRLESFLAALDDPRSRRARGARDGRVQQARRAHHDRRRQRR